MTGPFDPHSLARGVYASERIATISAKGCCAIADGLQVANGEGAGSVPRWPGHAIQYHSCDNLCGNLPTNDNNIYHAARMVCPDCKRTASEDA